MSMESTEKEPQLPAGTTAEELLNDYSEKARAEIAQGQGISAVAFNRFLNAQARRERIAASVSQANEILQKQPDVTERDENEVQSERAVVIGLKEVLRRFGPEDLTDEEIDSLEREAYAAAEELDTQPGIHAHTMKHTKVERMFGRVVEARAQNEISRLIEGGMTEADARQAIVVSLFKQRSRTNWPELRTALQEVEVKFGKGYTEWRGRETRNMPELESIVDGYGKRPLTAPESELLAAFVKAAKTYYFNNSYTGSDLLKKYRRMLGPVFAAYKNHGPHKRTMANVSGPAETFTSHQSEREAGYRRVGKARPHRDPSGGGGENW